MNPSVQSLCEMLNFSATHHVITQLLKNVGKILEKTVKLDITGYFKL